MGINPIIIALQRCCRNGKSIPHDSIVDIKIKSTSLKIKKIQDVVYVGDSSISCDRIFVLYSDYSIGWIIDSSCKKCLSCAKKFSMITSKHHCRLCGRIVCDKCSKYRFTVINLEEKGGSRCCELCRRSAANPSTDIKAISSSDINNSENSLIEDESSSASPHVDNACSSSFPTDDHTIDSVDAIGSTSLMQTISHIDNIDDVNNSSSNLLEVGVLAEVQTYDDCEVSPCDEISEEKSHNNNIGGNNLLCNEIIEEKTLQILSVDSEDKEVLPCDELNEEKPQEISSDGNILSYDDPKKEKLQILSMDCEEKTVDDFSHVITPEKPKIDIFDPCKLGLSPCINSSPMSQNDFLRIQSPSKERVIKSMYGSLPDNISCENLEEEKMELSDMNSMGWCYYMGQNVEEDHQKAFLLFQEAANHGNVEAMFNLGWCYYEGDGVQQSYSDAICWFQRAVAANGHVNALYLLGICFEEGKGIEKNWESALNYYEQSGSKGHVGSLYKLGLHCSANGNLNQSTNYFLDAAEKGHIEAMYNLAKCYFDGSGVERNVKQAFYWFEQAALRGHGLSMYHLGKCYSEGIGVAEDAFSAASWFDASAEKVTNSNTFTDLGLCYLNGKGVACDPERAVHYFLRASELKHPVAMFHLGNCYHEGIGVVKDSSQALFWYEKSGSLNNLDALTNVGWCYYNGYGIQKDYERAFFYLHKAAVEGHKVAMFNLAGCYFYGKGTSLNLPLSLLWYQRAADAGHIGAMYNWGLCQWKGIGISPDKNRGRYWINLAASWKHSAAMKMLQYIKDEK